jgi:hypothetical protein
VLALASKLGLRSMDAHQAIGCALGTGAVAATGLLGRRVADPAVGLVAAGLAAVYLPLVAADSLGGTESLFVLLVPLALLLALRLRDRPGLLAAAVLGVVLGVATLTRTEALLLVALLGIPLALGLPARRLATFAVICAGAALVVVPWSVRNSLLWDQPVGPSTTDGSVLAGANCPATYSGALIGRWEFGCLSRGVPSGLDSDEPAASARWRRVALDYAGDHAGRLPLVLAARELRTWSLYDPSNEAHIASFELGTPLWLEWLTLASAIAVAALALVGGVGLKRSGGPLGLLLAPVAMVAITSLLAYGQPRFRAGAEPVLALLAALGLAALAGRVSTRRGAAG